MSNATFIYLNLRIFHQVYLLYMCYLVKINNKQVLCLEDSENCIFVFFATVDSNYWSKILAVWVVWIYGNQCLRCWTVGTVRCWTVGGFLYQQMKCHSFYRALLVQVEIFKCSLDLFPWAWKFFVSYGICRVQTDWTQVTEKLPLEFLPFVFGEPMCRHLHVLRISLPYLCLEMLFKKVADMCNGPGLDNQIGYKRSVCLHNLGSVAKTRSYSSI